MGITIVGMGPGKRDMLTLEAWSILSSASNIYLRTERHPTIAELPSGISYISFDHFYETEERFEGVYERIVTTLLEEGKNAEIVYAVPGHPLVGESTVVALIAAADQQGVTVKIVPGVSFVETVLTSLRVDALDGLQLYDAIELSRRFYPPLDPNIPLLIGQVYNRLLASDLKIMLMAVFPDEHQVSLVHAAGTDRESIEVIPLHALDYSTQIEHLTSLYVPPLPYQASLAALAETVAVLRSPEGCPWDQEQTPSSMRSGFLEEAAEVLDALDGGDPVALREELGDMFYHLVMQAQMAAEAEEFTLSDVLAGIEAKLKRRHPHVWGDWEVSDSAEVVRNWEWLKQQENGGADDSLLASIPQAMPALARSQKIQSRVRTVGFDWPSIEGVYEKLAEEIAELEAAESPKDSLDELGDVLFVLTNLALWLDLDAESALRQANLRFSKRFRMLEKTLVERGLAWGEMSFEELDRLWIEVKETLANAG